ncbi:MAG: helix-turn-helix transcriptional regulator [Desulfovibrio sp.]|jgi:putative molybdopterin biosynthesis protein|nr:helix-turn-helix transcriptional regulator [Desulfovibrio sp.]
MEERGLSVEDVAEILRVGKGTVYSLVKNGELNHFKVGRKIRFTEEDVRLYVKASHDACQAGVPIPTELPYFDLSDEAKSKSYFIICGQDLILDILSNYMRHNGVPALRAYIGSYDSLISLYRNKIHVASSHLWDATDDSYNISYVRSLLPGVPCTIVHLTCRIQGLYVASGNPKNICSWEDFTRSDISMINREKGAGSRVLLDQNLKLRGISPAHISGYHNENQSHLAVASTVSRGEVDVAIGTEKIARQVDNIDFIPMKKERYDLVLRSEDMDSSEVELLLNIIRAPKFQKEFGNIGGYDLTNIGTVVCET